MVVFLVFFSSSLALLPFSVSIFNSTCFDFFPCLFSFFLFRFVFRMLIFLGFSCACFESFLFFLAVHGLMCHVALFPFLADIRLHRCLWKNYSFPRHSHPLQTRRSNDVTFALWNFPFIYFFSERFGPFFHLFYSPWPASICAK